MIRRRSALRDEPAQVDHPLDPGGLRVRAKFSAAARSLTMKRAVAGRALHRVDQEVRDLDAVKRAVKPCSGDRVGP